MKNSTDCQKIDEIYGDSGLLETAMKKPGVKEVMAVFDNWRALDKTLQWHQQVLGIKGVAYLSNDSGPIVREI